MSIILEITCTTTKVGIAGQEPDIIPIVYHKYRNEYPSHLELNDHSITPDQKHEILENLTPENQKLVSDYNQKLGSYLPLREEKVSKQLLQKLIHQALYENSYLTKKVFVVNHDFSANLQTKIREILMGLQIKSMYFISCSVLAVLGSNQRDGLVVYYSIESVKIYSVIDLRQIDMIEDLRVNEIHQNESLVQQLIDKFIAKSPIDIRKKLRDNIITMGDNLKPAKSIDCWTALSLYSNNYL